MAIAFVQASTGTFTAVATGTAVWSGDTTTGNTVIVGVCTNQASGLVSVTKVTDSQGNIYNPAKSFTNTVGGYVVEVWYASNVTGGTTPTVTFNSIRAITGGIIVREYSGLATVNSFDTGAGAAGSGASPSSGSTPIATRTANEVVVGVMIYGSVTPTISLGSGYSNLTLVTGGGSTHLGAEDKVVASSASQTATFGSTASAAFECAVVTFSDTTLSQPTTLNNYQFSSSGDGISVTEKIR